MLKLIFSLVFLMKFYKDWGIMQVGGFMLSFMFMLNCLHNFFYYEMGFNLGMDYISYMMILLSLWIICVTVLSSQSVKYKRMEESVFLLVNFLLLLALVVTFSSLDYMLFYISFEGSLIPTLILILGWGYQPERIQAGVYMLFYTLTFSLPLLGSLLLIMKSQGSLTINLVMFLQYWKNVKIFYCLALTMAFLVKLPMYLFHLWLPKAHVEAPLAGSMILAGVLLKLGGYGLIRVLMMLEEAVKEVIWIWISLSLIGGVYVSFLCLRQVDIKSLIAYSSVAHMGLVLCGILTISNWGFSGAVVVMVGHGLCSSGMFCLANVVYERVGSRSVLVNKGWLSLMPSMSLWWFLLSISNMASPPSLNLAGEIMLIITLVSWSKLSMIGLGLLSFFSGCYTLYLYSLSQHGVFYSGVYSCCSGKVQEYLSLFLHWLPLNVLVLNMNLLMI
uniref:NADH dehydrogenase subunit 4 n=1 Tax=Myra affinis TaxID=2800677 RepID=UPI001FAF8328|nr:NADH dehydrogenase subunit 4 [Myra affinis]UJP67371.1 NADH dehydrogenase subunit 4 [Myra affinis]